MISIGKGDAVIQILPPALRFWDKLGLTPKHGKKNQEIIVVFEDEGEQKRGQIQTWMKALCATYEVSCSSATLQHSNNVYSEQALWLLTTWLCTRVPSGWPFACAF